MKLEIQYAVRIPVAVPWTSPEQAEAAVRDHWAREHRDETVFPVSLVDEHAPVSVEFRTLLDEFLDKNDEAMRRLARGPSGEVAG